MYTSSEKYKKLLDENAGFECKVRINNVDFGQNVLISMQTSSKLFTEDTVSIGGCVSSDIDIVMHTPSITIPRMAEIRPYIRLVNDEEYSEWIPKGVYYIDERHADPEAGTLTIHGFDNMLKAEQIYTDGTGVWDRGMRDTLQDIASRMGVQVVNLASFSNDFKCQCDTTLTIREYLSNIACAHAGNFIFDYDGKLKLVKLNDLPPEPELLSDEAYSIITFGNTSILVSKDSGEVEKNRTGVGRLCTSFDYSPKFEPFSKVIINTSSETYVESGDDTGRTLKCECQWGTKAIADYILNKIKGYAYQPYNAVGARLDPCAELGDGVTINGVYSGIFSLDTNFSLVCSADITAPEDEEIDHEYAYESDKKRVERKLSNAYASLKVGIDNVHSEVTNGAGLISTINQTAEQVYINASKIVLDGTETTVNGKLTVQDADISNLKADVLTITGTLNAQSADISELQSDVASIERAYITSADVDEIVANSGYIKKAKADSLYASSGEFDDLVSGTTTAYYLRATYLRANTYVMVQGESFVPITLNGYRVLGVLNEGRTSTQSLTNDI